VSFSNLRLIVISERSVLLGGDAAESGLRKDPSQSETCRRWTEPRLTCLAVIDKTSARVKSDARARHAMVCDAKRKWSCSSLARES
jgi:hypothetical protein